MGRIGSIINNTIRKLLCEENELTDVLVVIVYYQTKGERYNTL